VIERAVLVTGASSGIGAATVEALANDGFIVYAGVRNGADAERMKASHANVRPLQLDVTDAQAIEAAAAAVQSGGVPLVGLVNNAGVAFGGPLETLPVDDLRTQFDVNVIGAMAVTQIFLPLLRAQPSRIVFIGSIAGRIAMPYFAPYCASKAALRALTSALRIELAPSHVDVTLIEPGSVATPIWSKGLAMRDAMLARLPASGSEHYRAAIDTVMRTLAGEQRNGMPVTRVADVVVRALTARKPKAHYIVGKRASIGALLALLPPSIHDRFLRATMRLQ
jgi:NAD(P)-dependent dehydrogenase (short-subunit alcohol dehydrogenase family)